MPLFDSHILYVYMASPAPPFTDAIPDVATILTHVVIGRRMLCVHLYAKLYHIVVMAAFMCCEIQFNFFWDLMLVNNKILVNRIIIG